MKKAISILMILCMLITAIPMAVSAAEDEPAPNPAAYPSFATDDWEALYAHATLGGDSSQAWQKWMKDNAGPHAEDGVRYFFLPATADDSRVEIYNGYNETAVVDGVSIPTKTSAFIDYTENKAISVKVGSSRNYTFKVFKSDSEASLYVNDITNSYTDYQGKTQNTDLWSFLTQNKENYVNGADYSIVSASGIEEGALKKIKGRGNTNWKETDKKPFNINFDKTTTIGHTSSKKFSLVANAKDSTLMRNAIMYNLANDVGNPYASDQSYIDFFVNGVYRGSYIACQKIEMGKNSVVSLKDESDDLETGFNFLVEVDVWNYANDVYFVSDKGFHVVLKTPDLEDFETNSAAYNTRLNYIKNKYQEFENALYKGTLADIEKICDLESLATQYLLQDLGKNCDGGYTSTFFTYNAAEDKFYAAPIWDCDSCLGAVKVNREGTKTSTSDHTGWTTRLATYNGVVNPLGRAFNVKGTSSKGQTFEQLCKEIWTNRFLPKIDVLLGKSQPDADDRSKSIDEYAKSIEKAAYIDHIRWDFMWLCQDKNSSLTDVYSNDYAGEVQYLKDWTKARSEWITANLGTSTPTTPTNPTNPSNPTDGREVYFTTDLGWDDVHFYFWGGSVSMKWPGYEAELVGTTEYGQEIYKAVITDTRAQKVIFNDGEDGAQTVSITIPSDNTYIYHTTTASDRINGAGEPYYNVSGEVYTAPTPTEPTTPTTTATEPETQLPTTSEPATSEPATKPALPDNAISAFVFDNTGKAEKDKLEEYGSKDEGYAATFGNGVLKASVNSDGYRALEWSAAEYGTDEIMVPIMSAGSKNPWGETPYVEVTLSTKNYKDIAISFTSAGSKKAPASWQLAYSTDGETFTDIEGANFTIALADRKKLISYFDNLALPEAVADCDTVTLRLYAASNATVNGGTTVDDPTGGELVIGDLIITGTAINTTPTVLVGDADMDGKVTIKDATTIQKYVADIETSIDLTNADCDFDAKITIKDATQIQKFVAELITEF